jgi:hypothetical protein
MAQNRIELDEELLYKLKLYAIDKGLPTRNQSIVNLAMKLSVESIEKIEIDFKNFVEELSNTSKKLSK